jgi:CDP-diacylglycerol--serine O-phosphatidyltransferase
MSRDKGRVRFLGRAADRPQRRFSRGASLLPSLFTMANLFCGYACVVYAMRGEYETAAPFIGVAIVLDMLDGRIARLTGTSTDFGLQFGSPT